MKPLIFFSLLLFVLSDDTIPDNLSVKQLTDRLRSLEKELNAKRRVLEDLKSSQEFWTLCLSYVEKGPDDFTFMTPEQLEECNEHKKQGSLPTTEFLMAEKARIGTDVYQLSKQIQMTKHKLKQKSQVDL